MDMLSRLGVALINSIIDGQSFDKVRELLPPPSRALLSLPPIEQALDSEYEN